VLREPLLYGDFVNLGSGDGNEPAVYEDLVEFETVSTVFGNVLERFNENMENKMTLVLFKDALNHLCRIHRVLKVRRRPVPGGDTLTSFRADAARQPAPGRSGRLGQAVAHAAGRLRRQDGRV
jgi:hypothetical protein